MFPALTACVSSMIVRAVKLREPYFEDTQQTTVAIPVWAELLLVMTTREGGVDAAMDGSQSSLCAVEFKRWSFLNKRFEAIENFRTRDFYDEFARWGSSFSSGQLSRWVAIDQDKRYVQFLVRVNVAGDQPMQLPPEFPVQYLAEHSLQVLKHYIDVKKNSLEKGISLNHAGVTGETLEKEMSATRKQVTRDTWAVERITKALGQLKGIKPFGEIEP